MSRSLKGDFQVMKLLLIVVLNGGCLDYNWHPYFIAVYIFAEIHINNRRSDDGADPFKHISREMHSSTLMSYIQLNACISLHIGEIHASQRRVDDDVIFAEFGLRRPLAFGKQIKLEVPLIIYPSQIVSGGS